MEKQTYKKEKKEVKAMKEKNKTIQELYNTVFDNNGKVQLCGRETCKKLIRTMQEVFPQVDFGEEETGCMKIENIQNYFNALKQV